MATYQFRCTGCESIVEIKSAYEDLPTKSCPECESPFSKLKRIYSCDFILKGYGWPGKTQKEDRDMLSSNQETGRRMHKVHDKPPEAVAYDYGNGDVRDAKEVEAKGDI